MLIRLKEDKELDKIIFNSKEEKLLNPSKDELATEIKTNVKTSVFGIKSQRMQTYSHNEYYTTLFFDIQYLSKQIIKEFLAGYYGVQPKDIIHMTKTKDGAISFKIYENYQKIEENERQNYMVFYKTTSEFLKQNTQKKIDTVGKLVEINFQTENPLNEEQYQNYFNYIQIDAINALSLKQKITFVKYNEFIKGKVNYPFKIFTRFPHFSQPFFIIQFVGKYFITMIFYLQTLQIKCSLIPVDMTISEKDILEEIKDLKFNVQKINKVYKTFRYQFLYQGTLHQQLKLLQKLQQYQYIKTHGQQYLLKGYSIWAEAESSTDKDNKESEDEELNDLEQPDIKITFFPNQNNLQIQIQAEVNKTQNNTVPQIITSNLTLLLNYFSIFEQDKIAFSTIQELQQLDPVEFGADDRYDYEKLVNDIRKRPIYKTLRIDTPEEMKRRIENWQKQQMEDKERKEKKKEEQSVENLQGAASLSLQGAAKGSSVFINYKSYGEKEIQEFKEIQKYLGQQAKIQNQTYYQGIYTTFQCSNYYPYFNLSQTNGKDAISCMIEPINLTGISIYDFYDVARRLLDNEQYLQKIKHLILGRVSISATKFTKWIIPGRCAELSIPLKKIFGSDNLLLSLIMVWSSGPNPYLFQIPMQIDDQWFQTCFGKKYDETFDGEIVYNADEEKWWAQNTNAKNPAVYVQYGLNKYLIIKDDIEVANNQYHFYKPYRISSTFKLEQQDFDIRKFKDFKIKGYFKVDYLKQCFLSTDKGDFPFKGDISNLQKLKPDQFNSPKMEDVLKICSLKLFDYLYINHNEKIIGGFVRDQHVFWKEEDNKDFEAFELKLGAYPILNIGYQTKFENRSYITPLRVVCFIIAREYYSQHLFKHIELTEENVFAIAKKYDYLNQDTKSISLPFTSVPEDEIKDGLSILNAVKPDTIEMEVAFIKQQALHHVGQDFEYDREKGEIIRIYKPTSKIYD